MLKVWAWLSGGSDVVPNCAVVPTAAHGFGAPGLQGLSARTQLNPFTNTEAVYPHWSWIFSVAQVPRNLNSWMVWSMGWTSSTKFPPGLPKAIPKGRWPSL